MTVNTEMFQKIYDQITQHPKTHDQGSWEGRIEGCGTTRCVAGWAIALHYSLSMDDHVYAAVPDTVQGRYFNDDEYLSSTAVAGAEILGLTDEQAYELFFNTNGEQAVEACLRYANKGDEA